MKRPPRLQVFQNRGLRWQYRVRAANGRKLDVSQPYASRSNAKRAARRLLAALEIKIAIEILEPRRA